MEQPLLLILRSQLSDNPIITVGGDTAPSSNDGKDRGVEFRYYDGSAKIGFFGYDRSANQFAFLTKVHI